MYEDLAWKHFLLTGNLESFLEYKKILESNQFTVKNEGERIDEAYKSERNCHTGSCI